MSDKPWTIYDDVDREALQDWLDERPFLRAEARPDPDEYRDLEER
jgi:hypothetical protein